jgi:hypothetical protein
LPTAGDTPAMLAASSLERPSAIAFQNGHRSDRCNTGGLPGDRSFARIDRSDFNFFELINTSGQDVLRRRVEFTQYASQDFRDVLTEYGFTPSMSRRGNCWDNACSETLFGSLKVERLYGQRFVMRRQAKDEVVAWLLWYNQTRLHSTLALRQPDTVRAGLACGSGHASQFVTRLWGKDSRGKVILVP